MANFEAWNDLGNVARVLYVQKYAIEEIDSLKPPKNDSTKISTQRARESNDKLRKYYNLFYYNQKDVEEHINPAYRPGQLALADRIETKVTSYLTEYGKIIAPDQPVVRIEFPEKLNLGHELEDWVAYEDYLLLKDEISEFNKLFSSVPHDVLPAMKQFQKEGANIIEVENIVNKIRSNVAFDTIIEAEIENVQNYRPFSDDNKDEFMAFANKAIQAIRFLKVFAIDDQGDEGVANMVQTITERLPQIVKRKWSEEVARRNDVPVYLKLDTFLRIPVDILFEEDKTGWWGWIGGIFSRILSKIMTTLREIW